MVKGIDVMMAQAARSVSSPGTAPYRDPSWQGPILQPPGAIHMSPSRHHDLESNTAH